MPTIRNGHSTDYIKRQAKKIGKEMGITHTEALNLAAKNAGFFNWQHCVNANGKSPTVGATKSTPRPSVLQFQMLFGSPSSKPNARMPVSAHQQIATLLKEVSYFTSDRKSIENHVGLVRTQLDDWVQKEHKTEEEMPSEVFHKMYYGGLEVLPDAQQRNHLISRLERVSDILNEHYHDCSPVRALHRKLDMAKKAISRWLELPEKPRSTRYRRPSSIESGTLIKIKSSGEHAIVYHPAFSGYGNAVHCYGHGGSYILARDEVTVPKDQSAASNFIPMRLTLPYGKWTCADGTEVLFNRDYCPIWYKTPTGKVGTLDPDTWISYVETNHYYNDGQIPWRKNSKGKREQCTAVLKEWGVDHLRPKIMELWGEAIATGNVDKLDSKNTKKRFPASKAA